MLLIAETAFETLVNAEPPMPMFLLMAVVGIIAIIAATVTKIATARARERTRRELAAYVAEGTIDPDKAIAMLEAGEPPAKGRRAGTPAPGRPPTADQVSA